jgi:uncharacterized protein
MTAASPRGAASAFALYVACVFVLGATLAMPSHGLLAALLDQPPALHKWTANLLKLLALLGLVPLLRLQAITLKHGLAIGSGRVVRTEALVGLVLGCTSMGLVLSVLLALDVRVAEPNLTMAMVLSAATRAAVVALLVASIEELWFRGALQSALRPCGPIAALVSVASVYALLHFLRPDTVFAPPYLWIDGVRAVGGMFGRLSDFAYLDSAIALLIAGLVLGCAREYTGRIALAWGIHVGWVFVIQSARRVTTLNDTDASWLVGHYDGFIGWAFSAVTVLLLVVAGLRWRARIRQ